MNLLKKDEEWAAALTLSVTLEFSILFPHAPKKDEIQH